MREKPIGRLERIATVVALLELFFSIQGQATGAEFYAMFFFIGTIICFGYVLEIQLRNTGFAFAAPAVENYIGNLQRTTGVLDDTLYVRLDAIRSGRIRIK